MGYGALMPSPETPARGDRDCELCGRQFDTDAELAEHVRGAHGGLDGKGPGGTGGAGSETGSGPTGTTTSGGPRGHTGNEAASEPTDTDAAR